VEANVEATFIHVDQAADLLIRGSVVKTYVDVPPKKHRLALLFAFQRGILFH
jgi:hypothetical protein